eukprot:scaffold1541_cov418-Prasinococcus_capsulatus_cf.AAC.24
MAITWSIVEEVTRRLGSDGSWTWAVHAVRVAVILFRSCRTYGGTGTGGIRLLLGLGAAQRQETVLAQPSSVRPSQGLGEV